MVMENVEVLMVDGVAVREQDDNHNRKAATIQLLIRSSQFEALNTAKYLGKLNVSLRPTADNGETNSEDLTDNGDAFLDWVKSAVTDEGAAPKTVTVEPKPTQTTMPSAPKKKMMVISPSGAEAYVWNEDGDIPQKVDSIDGQNGSAGSSSYGSAFGASSESPNSQGLTSGWFGMGSNGRTVQVGSRRPIQLPMTKRRRSPVLTTKTIVVPHQALPSS